MIHILYLSRYYLHYFHSSYLPFDIKVSFGFITFDLSSFRSSIGIYHLMFCPIRHLLLSMFSPFVSIYHSTALSFRCFFLQFDVFPVNLLSHSPFQSSTFFFTYFDVMLTNRKFGSIRVRLPNTVARIINSIRYLTSIVL